MVALGRIVSVNVQLYRQPLPPWPKRNLFFPSRSSRSDRFMNLPLLHQKPLKFVSCFFSSSSSSSSSSSMEAPPEGYRRNVGICLISPSNKIFAASRIDIPGAWQMPQGGVDEGEDSKIAALRELREETGVTSAEVIAEAPHWLTYDFPPEVREKLNKQWGSDWKGQAQKWFLLRFTGNDEEINLSGDGNEKAEFAEWAWMTPQQVIDLSVDFKKPVYEEVLKVFTPYLQSDSAGPS